MQSCFIPAVLPHIARPVQQSVQQVRGALSKPFAQIAPIMSGVTGKPANYQGIEAAIKKPPQYFGGGYLMAHPRGFEPLASAFGGRF